MLFGIALTLVSLMFFYYGLKAIISRETRVSSPDLSLSTVTGAMAVVLGVVWSVCGIGSLAGGITLMVAFFLGMASS